MPMRNSKWFQPVFAVVLGVIMLAAQWIGGRPGQGLVSLGIMVAFGAVLAFGGRSEAIRDLRGEDRDERMRQIHVRAVALTGHVVILAIVVAFTVEMARGRNGGPYTWLGTLAGVTYLAALLVLRARS